MLKRFLILSLMTWMTPGAFGQGTDDLFTATVSKSEVGLNERFRVIFTLKGEDSGFQPPGFKDFHLLAGPNTSTTMQYINGNFSKKVSYSFILQPTRTGTFEIQPARVKHKGEELKTDPVTIKVKKGSSTHKHRPHQKREDKRKQSRSLKEELSGRIILRAITSKRDPYRGEQVVVTYKLYSRANIVDFSLEEMPQLNGFWSQEFDLAKKLQVKEERWNGRRFKTMVIKKVALFPQKTGKLTIDPIEMSFVARVRTKRRGRGFFDDPFFDSPFMHGYRDVKFPAKSRSVEINVNPLPAHGKPSGFDGSVGRFNLSATLDQAQTRINEPVTLKITLSGRGNIKLLSQPSVEIPPGFESYDPKVQENIHQRGNRISGRKVFEYILIPRKPGNYKISPVNFSYFDPVKEKYLTLKTREFKLNIENPGGTLEASSPGGRQQRLQRIGKDIRYIRGTPGNLRQQGDHFFLSIPFFSLAVAPFLLFFGLILYRNRKKEIEKDVALLRKKKANKLARKHLRKAGKLLKAQDEKGFYDEVNNALWGYVSDKLNVPRADLSKENILNELLRREVHRATVDRLAELLNLSEQVRYAPVAGNNNAREVYRKALDLLSTIEREIK